MLELQAQMTTLDFVCVPRIQTRPLMLAQEVLYPSSQLSSSWHFLRRTLKNDTKVCHVSGVPYKEFSQSCLMAFYPQKTQASQTMLLHCQLS